jgi:hypothetical protein
MELDGSSSVWLVQGLRVAVVLLLYTFVLRLVWVLRRELRASTRTAVEERELAPVLVVIDVTADGAGYANGNGRQHRDEGGVGPPGLVGRRFPLAATNVIGRDQASTIVLPEPGVSRQHARLDYRDGEWWIDDLRSTNGTYVDEQSVEGPVQLLVDDVIRVGPVLLAVREEPV